MDNSSKVMVVGAGGMLGRELCRYLASKSVEVLPYRKKDLDITDEIGVYRRLSKIRPHVVVNCAAYSNLIGAEQNIMTAKAVNVDGARNLAKATNRYGIRLLHISSDNVFNGKKGEEYVEDDRADPVNVYGISKFCGEETVMKSNHRSVVLRIGWLYGNTQSSFLYRVFQKLYMKGELRVVDDQYGCPSSTEFVSKVIGSVLASPHLEGKYHVSHDNSANRFQFALFALLEKGYTKRDILPTRY